MKKVVIDTNALISLVTDRNPAQQEAAAALFDAATSLEVTILCHFSVITEFVHVLDKIYAIPKPQIAEMLADLEAMPGVEVVSDCTLGPLLSLWPDQSRDFGDAVLVTFCRSRRDVSLFSFDAELLKVARRLGVKLYRS